MSSDELEFNNDNFLPNDDDSDFEMDKPKKSTPKNGSGKVTPKASTKANPKKRVKIGDATSTDANSETSSVKKVSKPKGVKKVKNQITDFFGQNEGSTTTEQQTQISESEEPNPSPEQFRDLETGKSIEQIYQKKTQLEHILLRPDTYIGSTECNEQKMWILNEEDKKIIQKSIKYSPGLYKIFDEILVNAADNKQRDPNMKTIKVNIDPENNFISIQNDGKGIPIQIHQKEKVYVPELIFGHLLTSSNYNDQDKKVTGGRNGYGAKLCNIFSTEFIVETASKETEQKYYQKFTNNMSILNPPKILKNSKKEEYTRISFKPDLEKFGMDRLDEDVVALLKRRVYDLAGCLKKVSVYLNGSKIAINNFKQYVEMYLPTGDDGKKPSLIHDNLTRWEVIACVSEGEFQHMSFVNSISTPKGGTHLNHVADKIVKEIRQVVDKGKKTETKSSQIKNQMMLFVNCLIENPSFDSQTKENMTLPSGSFGSKFEMSDNFTKKIKTSEITESIRKWQIIKDEHSQTKSDGKKVRSITGIKNFVDAINAGTAKSKNCTLILTEGNSAKNLAVTGFSVVGPENFGVFPLRGKILNVRDASLKTVNENKELSNIKKILGLKTGTVYTDVSQLRYGHLMIMTDQDHDGSHIKGLLINYLDHFFPSLLKIPGFLKQFITPIVKVTKNKKTQAFFNLPEYERWRQENSNANGWKPKYYKGLATSTNEEARDYFRNLDTHQKDFAVCTDADRDEIKLAFSKDKIEARKQWLRGYQPGTYLDTTVSEIRHSDFINHELILFSMADNIRSIPSVVDSFKPGQRKILYGCFKYDLKESIKIEQLGGYISLHTAYHHGEMSLHSTIISMANDYVGNCNINLLTAEGQFGTRMQGGKDAGAARYLSTKLAPIARALYHIHDDPILTKQEEENKKIEPEWYVPVIPMTLVNGAEGIGTGWSTFIPNYNPQDLIDNLRRRMKNEPLVPMAPWYRGFKGNFSQIESQKWRVEGVIEKTDEKTIRITELPIRTWTENYKELLQKWMTQEKPILKEFQDYSGNANIDFRITLTEDQMAAAEKEGLLSRFGLISQVNTSNMVCFDSEGRIRKYDNPEEILEDFYQIRLKYYIERKKNLSDQLNQDFDKISEKARFILEVIKGTLKVQNRKKKEIIKDLRDKKYLPFPPGGKDSHDEDDDGESVENSKDYDYLLNMPIYNLTSEKVEKLLKEKDNTQKELELLLSRSPYDLWELDLLNVEKEWESVLELHRIEQESNSLGRSSHTKKGRGKKAGNMASKKSTKQNDDDEFAPNIGIKRKATSGTSNKGSSGQSTMEMFISKTPKTEEPHFTFESDKDDEDITKVLSGTPEKPTTSKKAQPATKKVKTTNSHDSDDVIEGIENPFASNPIFDLSGLDLDSPPTSTSAKPDTKVKTSAATPKPKQTPRKPATITKASSKSKKSDFDSDVSDNDEAIESSPVKPRSMPRRQTTTKRVYTVMDSGDDDDDFADDGDSDDYFGNDNDDDDE